MRPKFVHVLSVLSVSLSLEEYFGGRVPYTLHLEAPLCNGFHHLQPGLPGYTDLGPLRH